MVQTPLGSKLELNQSSDESGVVLLERGVAVRLDEAEAAQRRAKGELLFAPHSTSCTRWKQRARMPEHAREQMARRREARRHARLAEIVHGSARRRL